MATADPSGSPSGALRRGWPAAIAAVTVAAALVSCSASGGDDRTELVSSVVPSGACHNEVAAVEEARPISARRADLDGDGARDAVYVVKDREAAPDCRTFVVVDTGDVTYSANVSVPDHPEATGTALFRFVQLGGSDGAEIVFSAYESGLRTVTVYRILTFAGDRLQVVTGPHSTLVDDPSAPPVGAGCVAGRLVISTVSARGADRSRVVDRRFLTLEGAELKPRRVASRRVAPGATLDAVLPEFRRPLYGGC